MYFEKNTQINFNRIDEKISERGETGKTEFHENIGILTDDAFKDFLGIGDEFLEAYNDFQGVMAGIYENRQRSDLIRLIELWDKSQTYFSFLGDKP